MGHTVDMKWALFVVGLGTLVLILGYWFAAVQ